MPRLDPGFTNTLDHDPALAIDRMGLRSGSAARRFVARRRNGSLALHAFARPENGVMGSGHLSKLSASISRNARLMFLPITYDRSNLSHWERSSDLRISASV